MTTTQHVFNKNFIKHIELYETLLYGNFDEKLLDYIKQLYNGYCIDNCYVKNITKIITYTQPKITYESDIVIITIVEFEAEVIIFLPGQYLSCKIIQDENYLVCDWENILICNVKQHGKFNGLSKGDIIPIVLTDITYYDKKIISGGNILLTDSLFTTAFKITKDTEDVPNVSSATVVNSTVSPIVLNDNGKYLYNILSKKNHKTTTILTSNVAINDYVCFAGIDKDKIKLEKLSSIENIPYINMEKSKLESNIIYKYNNLVNFLNSLELKEKIKLLYDNI